MTAIILLVLAVLLAWPIPLWLSKQAVLWAHPFGAMVLWQSIAVAGLLSLVSAPLALALRPFGDSLGTALITFLTQGSFTAALTQLSTIGLVALGVSFVLTVLLLSVLVIMVTKLQREVNSHKKLVRLLGEKDVSKHTFVLPSVQPVAYCLPGFFQPVTVISSGLKEVLTPAEFATVLAHEKAHLRQNHHLLLATFLTWHRAMPFLPVTKTAHIAVSTLVEILADQAVLKHAKREDLVNAVITAYPQGQFEPSDSFVPGMGNSEEISPSLSPRLKELVLPSPQSQRLSVTLIAAGTALIVLVLALIFFAPL